MPKHGALIGEEPPRYMSRTITIREDQYNDIDARAKRDQCSFSQALRTMLAEHKRNQKEK